MPKIVFCEDNDVLRKLIQVALRPSTHQIYFAVNGMEGLELIERVSPDLVFTDLQMPVCDGIQLNSLMKSKPELAHIPVILMTASGRDQAIAEATRNGMAGYLLKPFLIAELRDKVEEYSLTLKH